jgi:hypothetical protein
MRNPPAGCESQEIVSAIRKQIGAHAIPPIVPTEEFQSK